MMKRQYEIISILTIAVIFSFTGTLFAGEGGHQEGVAQHGEVSGVPIPKTESGIWHLIQENQGELAEVIDAGKLSEVHKLAFRIHDLSKELIEKTTVLDASKKSKVESAVNRMGKVAAFLDQYGDAGDKANTVAQFERLKKLIKFIEIQYPEEVLSQTGDHHSQEGGENHH